MHDVVFISYNESNAELNWHRLRKCVPRAKRLHGITGLHTAHAIAASMVSTTMFYVVDGDAVINDNFKFDYTINENKQDWVHVFRASNPVNGLIYGYGAVKLLPTADVLTVANGSLKPDVTTSINRKYEVVDILSNVTVFNTSEFNTWRSAFRECAKLSSKIIPGQVDSETDRRLDVWCTVGDDDTVPFGTICTRGAIAGKEYGLANGADVDAMLRINDMSYMQTLFYLQAQGV